MPSESKKTPKRSKTQSKDQLRVEGLKYFAMLRPLLSHLHNDQCSRDKAGNRTLHYDQYCMLVLLYVLNPTVSSLRALAQASELTKVRSKLQTEKASLGSLSESSRLFDAERLKEIIGALSSQVTDCNHDPRLDGLTQKLVAVDGSLVNALPSLITASILKQTCGSGLVQWRLHTHFEVSNLMPSRVDVTANDGGENDERAVMQRVVEGDRMCVMDRGYAKFTLFNAIVQAESSYACRLRDNTICDLVEDRPLTDGDRTAGVLSDQVVLLGQSSKKSDRPDHPIRIVQVRCTPHHNRTGGKVKGSKAPNSDGILRIATNLLDVPAEIIALIYSYRWTIESFFRFYKQLMGGSHLISHSQNGIEIQVYCSTIACLLINHWAGQSLDWRKSQQTNLRDG